MLRTALLAGLILASAGVRAQDGHHGGPAAAPSEPGQSAFAAIAEIVAMLRADPATDWGKVDIGALRAHLADMDVVVLQARAESAEIDDGLAITAVGDGLVGGAIRRMVTAHAPTLDALDGIAATAVATDGGAVLRVTGEDEATVRQIRALGFFGLMATGAHHQAHHWAIATGGSPHDR